MAPRVSKSRAKKKSTTHSTSSSLRTSSAKPSKPSPRHRPTANSPRRSSKNWDLSFLQGILNQFSTLPAATRGKTVSEIKEQLEDFASKKFAKNPANARNGLLHLCNPNIYAPIYSFADKLAICKEQSRLLEDFKLSNRWDSGLLKLKVFRKDGYVAIQTDEQLCWIFDKLSVMHKIEDEEFEQFMKNYFTAPKKSSAKKK